MSHLLSIENLQVTFPTEDGFVKAVGVQALRTAKHRSHGLDGGAHNVVVGVLLGQAPARPLLLAPLAAYVVAVVAQTLASSSHCLFNAARVAPLIFTSHVFYGLGFWKGLFTRPQPKSPEQVGVTLQTILPA